jgi:hypothetical protein
LIIHAWEASASGDSHRFDLFFKNASDQGSKLKTIVHCFYGFTGRILLFRQLLRQSLDPANDRILVAEEHILLPDK